MQRLSLRQLRINFQERFKNRISQIDKFGTIDIGGSSGVNKPSHSQIFDSNPNPSLLNFENPYIGIRSSFESHLKDQVGTPKLQKISDISQRKQTQSANPIRMFGGEEQKNALISTKLSPVQEYTPYTLKDYEIIKPAKYYELGGLGPSTIGTETWRVKKQIFNRRQEYVKQLRFSNILPPSNMRHPASKNLATETQKHEKTNKNSRMKITGFVSPPISSVLEELEKKTYK